MISTGLEGLDKALTGLRKGDNVVWQVEDVNDYRLFVDPYIKNALKEKKKILYIRFASHKPLIKDGEKVKTYHLDANKGFESFTTQINAIITKEGKGAYYLFDCLSDLLPAWATDLMIGNFFMVTCPYLYELDTIAYFAILRNNHSFKTIARIRETTQLLLDVYNCEGTCYLHPLKVWNRYSPTMFLPHYKDGGKLIPITDSANAARLLTHISGRGAESVQRNLDYWDRLFLQAEGLLGSGSSKGERKLMFDYLCKILVTRDNKIMPLVAKHLTLEDLINIKVKMVGTGLIGGKAIGMLLARKMLTADKTEKWENLLEEHDSFYIGADVFYTYIVQNGWWKLRTEQKTKKGYLDAARVLREKMFLGKFPAGIVERFQQVIEYFGTSPIIVRSSSLLEDGFGNAFAGKYESIFCANQGTPEERYGKFVEAIKKVYASTMSEEALIYRLQRGLDKRDEQMALLVQRVSGSYHKKYFFPDIAGVGVSFNTYVWNEKIKAEDGMVRLVAGLGTRAVNREEGDYARVVALDEPLLRPYSEIGDIRKFSQHHIDLIAVKQNEFKTMPFSELTWEKHQLRINDIAVKDENMAREMEARGIEGKDYWILTFDKLLTNSSVVSVLKKALKVLETQYKYPVDIEFTINFNKEKSFKINLLQCRSLQTRGLGKKVVIPDKLVRDKILFDSKGHFLGGNISQPISRVIYVSPEKYSGLKLQDQYEVARIIGSLNYQIKSKEELPTLLMGPGRWGTSTPAMGVPVTFFEINHTTVLVEVAFERGSLVPELSFGTHFFQDLVESDIFYIALFPQKAGVVFNEEWFRSADNLLEKILPQHARFKDVVGVYDVKDQGLKVMSDIISQRVVSFMET